MIDTNLTNFRVWRVLKWINNMETWFKWYNFVPRIKKKNTNFDLISEQKRKREKERISVWRTYRNQNKILNSGVFFWSMKLKPWRIKRRCEIWSLCSNRSNSKNASSPGHSSAKEHSSDSGALNQGPICLIKITLGKNKVQINQNNLKMNHKVCIYREQLYWFYLSVSWQPIVPLCNWAQSSWERKD